jgi:hypothetical protein
MAANGTAAASSNDMLSGLRETNSSALFAYSLQAPVGSSQYQLDQHG